MSKCYKNQIVGVRSVCFNFKCEISGRTKETTQFLQYKRQCFLGTGVTCNCLHPGLVKTNLGQYMRGDHTPFFQRMMFKLFWPLAMLTFITPKKGAETSIYCSVAPELDDVTGKYFAYVFSYYDAAIK